MYTFSDGFETADLDIAAKHAQATGARAQWKAAETAAPPSPGPGPRVPQGKP
jgi:hypothetical protein